MKLLTLAIWLALASAILAQSDAGTAPPQEAVPSATPSPEPAVAEQPETTVPAPPPQATTTPPPPAVDTLGGRIEATAQQMDTDLTGALEVLEHLATDSTQLRTTRPITAEERPLHSRLFLLLARGRMQNMDNVKAEEAIRELLRIDPLFAGQLTPREQELFDGLRNREMGTIEILSRERGARIVIEGIDLGLTSDAPVRARLLSGSYEVRAEKIGYRAAVQRVNIVPAQIVTITDLTPERNVPPLAFLSDTDNVEVVVDNVAVGKTARLATLRSQVAPEVGAALDRAVAASKLDPASAAGILIRDPAIDRPITARFRRECFVDETRSVTVSTDLLTRLDPMESLLWMGEAGLAKMRRDMATLRVTSTPRDADVFLDGQLAGRTPFEQEVCAGSRRVRVRHRIGSFNVALTLSTGRTEVLDIALKPDIAFVGAAEDAGGTLRPSPDLTTNFNRALVSNVTTFHLATPVDLPSESSRWTEKSTVDLVTAVDKNDQEALARLAKQASFNFDTPLLVAAVRRAAAGTEAPVDLLIFWAEHNAIDRIRVPDSSEKSLAGALSSIGGPADPTSLVYRPDVGFRVADTALADAPLVVAAIQKGSSAAGAGIKAGDVIKSVDGQPATATQFAEAVRRKQAGDTVSLSVATGSEVPRTVQVPVQRRPARAPVFDTALPGNALIARLSAASQTASGSDRDVLAYSLALAYMRFGEWRHALELLAPLGNLPIGDGIGRGAALYFRARCHEELGERDKAIPLYKDASAIEDEVLGDDGASVGALSRYRLALLIELAAAAAAPAAPSRP